MKEDTKQPVPCWFVTIIIILFSVASYGAAYGFAYLISKHHITAFAIGIPLTIYTGGIIIAIIAGIVSLTICIRDCCIKKPQENVQNDIQTPSDLPPRDEDLIDICDSTNSNTSSGDLISLD